MKKILCLVSALMLLFLSMGSVHAKDICYGHNEHNLCCVAYEKENKQEAQNLLCSLLGHNLEIYEIRIVTSEYIDVKTCRVYYVKDGFCSRCNEYVLYRYDSVMNHSITYDYDRWYCKYGCGWGGAIVR